MFFDRHQEFISADNRNKRIDSQVTSESMTKRCEAFLPIELIKNKSILDLGCCVGAMGAWCLENGAVSYTGIEAQNEYAKTAHTLLSKYKHKAKIINSDINSFLDKCIQNKTRFDIIICLGVIYVFLDPIQVLQKLSKISNKSIVIDSMFPVFDYEGKRVIEFNEGQKINAANEDAAGFTGIASRMSPDAMQFILSSLGFKGEQLFPTPIVNAHDPYNDLTVSKNRRNMPSKYAFRFDKIDNFKTNLLEDNLKKNNIESIQPFNVPEIIKK